MTTTKPDAQHHDLPTADLAPDPTRERPASAELWLAAPHSASREDEPAPSAPVAISPNATLLALISALDAHTAAILEAITAIQRRAPAIPRRTKPSPPPTAIPNPAPTKPVRTARKPRRLSPKPRSRASRKARLPR